MQKPAPVEKVAVSFKGVKDLIEMKLMAIVDNGHTVRFAEALWTGKNKKFKKNWCTNIYTYCRAKHNMKVDANVIFFMETEPDYILMTVAKFTGKNFVLYKN